ncbi:MAG TPA: RdgB/HAM1 family non-canonical purine NTP pyrophosphatase [Candidatus Eisenbergiella merdipullorum]|uniref:dITP/XTP pyrophosphatase n=1 Tax=Candidatus Eisenbergiella merdipullorum TaxID=2838553 RepID=A0A9D2I396_9FIRM|nr:RdgB/HAM1 family non-canonical purine NTP pyrophosphatase [Candidatus Eisenbergiella merdipullorum]
MSERILFATGNEGKMREVRMILENMNIPVLSMKEAGIDPVIEENGSTFEENALIKARAVAACAGPQDIVLADDSGLEIDHLNKEPGIYSARYMGEDTSYRIKNANLIKRLDGVPKEQRTARFVCAIAAVLPPGRKYEKLEDREFVVRGTIEGYIGWEERGTNGFGYDPIFYVDEFGCSTAELDSETKNRISHRGKALRLCEERLKELL